MNASTGAPKESGGHTQQSKKEKSFCSEVADAIVCYCIIDGIVDCICCILKNDD